MKKKLIITPTLILFFLTLLSCSDTSGLQNQIDNIENRVAVLEKLTAQLNTNISALQTAVLALQNNDYITNLTEIKEGTNIIGYTITFAKNGTATIYNGKDGKDGITPVIGVKQFTDGTYYWTLNGSWLTDVNGNKIWAQGVDGTPGKDGITPQLKIENENWMLSVDNGLTWRNLGKATGTDGKEGDSFFQDVTQDENSVYLTLADGTSIALPKEKQLSISFDESIDISITDGATKLVKYTITGTTSETIVKAVAQNGWFAKVIPTNNESGTISVTAPEPMTNNEILVLVYDGKAKTIMSSLNFVTGIITVVSNTYSLPKEASSETVTVNTDIDYIVDIPSEAKSWISVVSTRSAMRTETLTFNLTENTGFTRYATVYLKNNAGKVLQSIAFEQEGSSVVLKVSTPGTLSSLLTNEQKQNLKNLTVEGTLNNNDFLFISEMPSLQYLDISNITNNELSVGFFQNNNTIIEVKLPNNLKSIPDYLFKGSSIKKCHIPKSVTTISKHAFHYSKISGDLIIPSSVVEIKEYAFYECRFLSGNLILNEGLNIIGHLAFGGCDGLTGGLTLPSTVTSIGTNAFLGCKGFLGDLIIPSQVVSIGGGAFNNCTGIKNIYSKNPTPPSLEGTSIFPNYIFLGVPLGSKINYQNAFPEYDWLNKWSDFLTIEEVDFEALGI